MTTCMQLLVGGGHGTFSRCFPQETKITATGEGADLNKFMHINTFSCKCGQPS